LLLVVACLFVQTISQYAVGLSVVIAPPGYATRSFRTVGRTDECHEASQLVAGLRRRMLNTFHVTTVPRAGDNRQHGDIKCTIIARRDYVAHPRNPAGRVERKWADERGIVDAIRQHAGITCDLVDLAQLTIRQQFQLIAQV